MKANFRTSAAIAATAMGLVLTTPAHAQDRAGYSDDAIVVTARRFEENLQDVPISITVFNQEQLDQRNITSTTDLATYTPSLSLNSRYGPEKASFVIRGFSQELQTLPTVVVYFADVPAPYLSSNITSGNGAGPGDLFDLQNVQVLKGPQGTLFGRNSTGGAILLVPKKPSDELEGYVEGTYGNYDQRRVQAVVNVPLAETFKVRAGVDWNKRDGYINNTSGIGPDDFGDVDYIAARLSILAELTPDLENYTIFKYSKTHTNYIVPKLVYCDPGAFNQAAFADCQAQLQRQAGRGYYDVENPVADPFVKARNWQIINTTTWNVSDTLTIKNIASYGEAREAYRFSLDGDLYFDALGGVGTFVTVNPGPTQPQGNQYSFSEELQLQGRSVDGRLTWQAGGYMEKSKPNGGRVAQQQWSVFRGACTDVYNFICTSGAVFPANNTYSVDNYGLYAQATYDLSEQFALTGGFRYNWDKVSTDASNALVAGSPNGPVFAACRRAGPAFGLTREQLFDGTCNRSFSTKSSDPTWLINLDYKPTPDILVYAKYARGYRGGGVNEANVNFETWDPETVDLYELGVKTTWRGSSVRGTFNITGFWNEFKDQQASVFIPTCLDFGGTSPPCASIGINAIQNVGASRMRGIEADASFTFFDDLRFDIGYAYLDTEVLEVTTPNCDPVIYQCDRANFFASPGERLAFSPKNRITVTAAYTLPLDESVGDITLSATFTHTDEQFHINSNRPAFEAGRIPFDAGIIPATDLLNLNLDWKNIAGSQFDFALFANNVTNEKYWVAAANGINSIGGEAVILGQPRFYGMRVRFNFGE